MSARFTERAFGRWQRELEASLQALPAPARAPVPLALGALALAGGLLLSFHHVVARAVEHAQWQRSVVAEHDQAVAPCRQLDDSRSRHLCVARVEAQMLADAR